MSKNVKHLKLLRAGKKILGWAGFGPPDHSLETLFYCIHCLAFTKPSLESNLGLIIIHPAKNVSIFPQLTCFQVIQIFPTIVSSFLPSQSLTSTWLSYSYPFPVSQQAIIHPNSYPTPNPSSAFHHSPENNVQLQRPLTSLPPSIFPTALQSIAT